MTDQDLFSNRTKAHASTGPRTDDGKARSSANSLKHGLTARHIVLPGEDPAEFDRTLENLIAQHQTEGALETEIVGEIAGGLWRLSRARKYEGLVLGDPSALFGDTSRPNTGFDRLLRYTGSIERQLNRPSPSTNHYPLTTSALLTTDN
jgi:hypothetical protein